MSREFSKITRIDILKMLLYAPNSFGALNSPIRGKVRLQKEIFLAQKALRDRKIKRLYGFMPYHYGPFSRQLYRDVDWLEQKGLVEVKSYPIDDQGVYREFKLTSEGKREVECLLQDREMRDVYDIVKRVKEQYDNMPLVRLVEFTHRAFPEYKGKYEY